MCPRIFLIRSSSLILMRKARALPAGRSTGGKETSARAEAVLKNGSRDSHRPRIFTIGIAIT